MAKVSQQKSEKITAFGGIFFVLDKFDSILSSVIDSHLGLRSRLIGYQYSEIIRAFSLFRFIAVPAKWVRTARQYKLNIYSNKPYKLIHRRACQVWEHGLI
jgi:hypothetical protein